MRAEARIDLDHLSFNINLLKNLSGTALMAVVKADAYGHGLVEVGLAAEKAGADWLGVALLEEAIKLRTHGVRVSFRYLIRYEFLVCLEVLQSL